ncbi:GNAT family N-acetyltransferase [Streptomyces sp. NPDC002088]|uniref:GNAT family N-acetyltransferase n=1 Tax=Streptomyces sp. NPDC002088 TaxID=3154665 RepID=UPI00332FC5BD
MTDTQTLLDAYDAQMRRTPPPGVAHEYDGPLLRMDLGYRGFVTGPRDLGGLHGRELDELIIRQRDFFAARGKAVEWKVRGHDAPPDLTDRLRAAGFEPETQETVLVCPVAELAVETPAPPDGVTLRQVTADADMHRTAALETAIWGLDLSEIADDLIRRVARTPDEIAVLVAEAEGEVVSAAWLIFRPGTEFAALMGGSTLAEWRGKGIYRALVAARAELAAARGVRYLHVDASDDSAPILRRLGFRAVTTTTPYVWSPPGDRQRQDTDQQSQDTDRPR